MADYTDCTGGPNANASPFTIGVNDQPSADFTGVVIAYASNTTVFTNRVFDSVAGEFVSWNSPTIDSAGLNYPGPGTFGVDTSGYAYTSSR